VLVDHPAGCHDDYANVTCLAIAILAKQAGGRPWGLSCDGHTLIMNDASAESVAPMSPVAPGVLAMSPPDAELAEQVKQIRTKPLCMRSPDETRLVDRFFASQREQWTQADPISQAARHGGWFPSERPPDLDTELRDVRETLRRWR
jgi:hypothetical protein